LVFWNETKDLKLSLTNVREVKGQKSDWVPQPKNQWWGDLQGPHEITGYLSWSIQAPFILKEFLITDSSGLWQKAYRSFAKGTDKTLQPNFIFLPGVPALQQFPLQEGANTPVASGCVPTAGASLMLYWSQHGLGKWCSSNLKPEDVVLRLRQQLDMAVLPDDEGFTDHKMSLAGAYPKNLTKAIGADATKYGLTGKIEYHTIDLKLYLSELEAGRPVLLSCTVPLPQKPALSWGHEVVGVGYLRLNEQVYLGVIDNFLPLGNQGAPRWIAAHHFSDMITVQLNQPAGSNAK
jgi:hypothetical protein